MNKKQYISPSSTVVYANVQTYLHGIYNTTNQMAAPDLRNDDVSLSGTLGLDKNEEAAGVTFSNQRGGFGSDSGPWESLW